MQIPRAVMGDPAGQPPAVSGNCAASYPPCSVSVRADSAAIIVCEVGPYNAVLHYAFCPGDRYASAVPGTCTIALDDAFHNNRTAACHIDSTATTDSPVSFYSAIEYCRAAVEAVDATSPVRNISAGDGETVED